MSVDLREPNQFESDTQLDSEPFTENARSPGEFMALLQCPACQGELIEESDALTCCTPSCRERFPIAQCGPILVNESNSIFDKQTFLKQQATFFKPTGWFRELVSRCLPDPSANVSATKNFAEFRDQLLRRSDRPTVLVVGGSIIGDGMDVLVNDPRIKLVETDAAVGPRTQLVCDAHDLPFKNVSLDGVIVQAVLEHVADPHRCVAEIYRVLKTDGLVYSDTPFMQQVHGREFDFTRFTRLGHRRLFNRFEELSSGITCGPGMALAWSLRYFLLSFFSSPRCRALASGFSRLAFFWLIYIDRYLQTKPSANDAASAFYFMGAKSDETLSDRDLVASYVGGF